jgi:hypothetical protein
VFNDVLLASSGSAMRRKLLTLQAMLAAGPAADPWSAAEHGVATVDSSTFTGSGIPTNIAASGSANRWSVNGASAILATGGIPFTFATNYVKANTGMVSAGVANTSYAMVDFGTVTTQYFAFRVLGSTEPYLVELDGKFISKAGHLTGATSGTCWIVVDRGAAAIGVECRPIIWVGGSPGVDALYPGTGGTVGAIPESTWDETIAIIGDSIVDGPTINARGFVPQMARLLNFRRHMGVGVTGTSYAYDGGSSLYTVLQRVPNITGVDNGEVAGLIGNTLSPNIGLAVFDASINAIASGTSAATEAAAAARAFDLFRAHLPNVPVVVFGPPDRNAPSAVEAGFDAMEAALREVCASRSGFCFKSLRGYSYTKIDATHPDYPGNSEMAWFKAMLAEEAVNDMVLGLDTSSLRVHDPDVLLWRAAVVVAGGTVSNTRLSIINDFVYAEKTVGNWALTDDYWGLWGENSTQALVSLKQRRLATLVNSPTFTADRQYAFDGSTNYINTGFVPSTHGVNYTGSSQRIAAYERVNVSASAYAAGARVGTATSIGIIPRASGSMTGIVNNTAGSAAFVLGVADSRGLKAVSRAGGTTALGYDRGVRLTDAPGLTIGGSAAPAQPIYIGCLDSSAIPISFRAASVGFIAIGAPLSDAQELAQYNAVQAWATAIGANV